MAHKLIKYRLEANGTIPTFLTFGISTMATHGLFPVIDSSTASPRDRIMLGFANDGANISGAVGEITSKADLLTYLTNVSVVDGVQTWKLYGSDDEENATDFVPSNAADGLWNDLETLNS